MSAGVCQGSEFSLKPFSSLPSCINSGQESDQDWPKGRFRPIWFQPLIISVSSKLFGIAVVRLVLIQISDYRERKLRHREGEGWGKWAREPGTGGDLIPPRRASSYAGRAQGRGSQTSGSVWSLWMGCCQQLQSAAMWDCWF